MEKNYKLEAMPRAQAGWVYLCEYCGEGVSKGNKLCKTCKTKKGREEILQENQKILVELRVKGYCKEAVCLPVA
jgi:hypothetical protein